jgi:hypothetical protein
LCWPLFCLLVTLPNCWNNVATAVNMSSRDELERGLLYDWRFTANQYVLAPSPLRPTTRDLLFCNWTLAALVLTTTIDFFN